LFVGFIATMAECDFSRPFITGYGSSPSRHGPARRRGRPAIHEISRFPKYRELTHMPGSTTTPDRRALAKPCLPYFAFRSVNGVGIRNKYLSRLNGWPMRTPADASDLPSRTSTHGLGSDVVRYSFIAMDFHLLLSAGLPGASDSALFSLPSERCIADEINALSP
jgi:hypothetical protein